MVKTVAIVSLSAGTIGEDFVKHEVSLGLRRLGEMGLRVKMMPHAMCGRKYVQDHPAERAADLLAAFADDSVDMILCAIGGEDTYRLLPYLFGHDELKNAVKKKIFLGFSDSTVNHLMLHKAGLDTFYGQAFLSDVCELDRGMLPYSRRYFEELIRTGSVARITPSDVWYESREDFSTEAMGTQTPSHPNEGFRLLQGPARFEGKILGGCIDTIFDIFNGERFADSPGMCRKYGLFPKLEDWKGRILLLETSEEKATPEKYRRMLTVLKEYGLFGVVSGVLAGKPADETYADAYEEILKDMIADPGLPVITNVNVGHAQPRCIIPFGVHAVADAERQEIVFG